MNAVTLQTAQPLRPRRLDNTVSLVTELVSWWKDGELDMDQPYQRGDVWTDDQRRLFVKSLMEGIQVPGLILNDRLAAHYKDPLGNPDTRFGIVDGKQRVTTFVRWFGGDLAIPASWFAPDEVESTEETHDGPYVRFPGLSIVTCRVQRLDFTIPQSRGRLGTMAKEAELFCLVNRAGTPMTEEDLARAMSVAKEGKDA